MLLFEQFLPSSSCPPILFYILSSLFQEWRTFLVIASGHPQAVASLSCGFLFNLSFHLKHHAVPLIDPQCGVALKQDFFSRHFRSFHQYDHCSPPLFYYSNPQVLPCAFLDEVSFIVHMHNHINVQILYFSVVKLFFL